MWGSEFTAKAATIQGGFSRNRCWAKQNFERLRDFLRASLSPLKQLSLIWNSHRKKCFRWPRGGPRRGNARHCRPKHAATRLPSAGPPEAHAEIFAACEVIDFALVTAYGLCYGSASRVAGRAGNNLRHRPKHSASRLPLAGPPEARAETLLRLRRH